MDLSSSIINKIMDMDLNDDIAVKNVIDIITNHACRNAFFLGSLLGTSMHQNVKLEKSLFYYHDAHTPDDLHAYIFKQNGKQNGFLVNIAESQVDQNLDDYWGDYTDIEDIPLVPVSYKGIDEVVRIDVSTENNFKIRKVTVSNMSRNELADGRFNTVPTIYVTDIIVSLHKREEGYKAIDRLTHFGHYEENLQSSDTFENKILNYIHLLQRNIRNTGDLKAFVEGILVGVKVYHPYDAECPDIMAIQSSDDTVFMIAFSHISSPTKDEQNIELDSNLKNLLTQYIFDYTLDESKVNVILLAITYNTCFEPEFDSVDNIISFRYTPETEVSKNRLESYLLELAGRPEILQ